MRGKSLSVIYRKGQREHARPVSLSLCDLSKLQTGMQHAGTYTQTHKHTRNPVNSTGFVPGRGIPRMRDRSLSSISACWCQIAASASPRDSRTYQGKRKYQAEGQKANQFKHSWKKDGIRERYRRPINSKIYEVKIMCR